MAEIYLFNQFTGVNKLNKSDHTFANRFMELVKNYVHIHCSHTLFSYIVLIHCHKVKSFTIFFIFH